MRKLAELSQIDGRFDPGLLDAVLRHLLDVWEEASTGSSEPLRSLCCEEAASELLHPVPSQPALTFVLSGASLEGWEPTVVASDTEPGRVTVELTASAVRFLVNRENGEYAAGSRGVRHRMELSWTLGLFRTARYQWRLLASSNPAAVIRGLPDDLAAAPDDDQLHQERAALRAARLEHRLRAESQPPAVHEGASQAVADPAAPNRVRKAITTLSKAFTRLKQ